MLDLRRGIHMRKASYKRLWKLLIDKDMNKKTLAAKADISVSSLAKMGREETVTVETLVKICNAIDCDISDIMELVEVDK
jgi:DNA-binding Xre family transcriptional regulator